MCAVWCVMHNIQNVCHSVNFACFTLNVPFSHLLTNNVTHRQCSVRLALWSNGLHTHMRQCKGSAELRRLQASVSDALLLCCYVCVCDVEVNLSRSSDLYCVYALYINSGSDQRAVRSQARSCMMRLIWLNPTTCNIKGGFPGNQANASTVTNPLDCEFVVCWRFPRDL